MKKLNLDLNGLHVEKFEVEPDAEVRDGTVVANATPGTLRSCGPDTCYPQYSCATGSPCRRCVAI
jgi:hypothetical protein